MIFWDPSALIPVLVAEKASEPMLRIMRDAPSPMVWWGTLVECQSAIARREREGVLSQSGAEQARMLLGELQAGWAEVAPIAAVRAQAGLLLRRHPLGAADALQLAAALVTVEGRPEMLHFLTLDQRLARAAHGEGFPLLFPLDAMPG